MIVDRRKLKPIANLDDQTCFGCGSSNPIGLKMEFFTDKQNVFSFVSVPSEMTGWDETVHGGILTTIIDEVMGWTVIHLLKKIGVTRSITVEFLKPVIAAEHLTVVGSLLEERSERSIEISGDIYNSKDQLCARGVGTFSIMKPKTAVRLGVIGEDYMARFEKILKPE